MRCHRRNPHAAHIAIILDTYGGARTIVADRRSMRENVRQDEMALVVPNLLVHEPIAWNDIPIVIERARLELEKWLATRPNLNELQHQIVTMYRLRCLEHSGSKRSFDPSAIVET